MKEESKTNIALLQSLNEGLKKDMKDLRTELERLGDGFDRKEKRIGELEADNKRLDMAYKGWYQAHRKAKEEAGTLLRERSGTLKLLRKLEWCDDGSGLLVCPCCGKGKGTGHFRNCELDAAIRKGGEQ